MFLTQTWSKQMVVLSGRNEKLSQFPTHNSPYSSIMSCRNNQHIKLKMWNGVDLFQFIIIHAIFIKCRIQGHWYISRYTEEKSHFEGEGVNIYWKGINPEVSHLIRIQMFKIIIIKGGGGSYLKQYPKVENEGGSRSFQNHIAWYMNGPLFLNEY